MLQAVVEAAMPAVHWDQFFLLAALDRAAIDIGLAFCLSWIRLAFTVYVAADSHIRQIASSTWHRVTAEGTNGHLDVFANANSAPMVSILEVVLTINFSAGVTLHGQKI